MQSVLWEIAQALVFVSSTPRRLAQREIEKVGKTATLKSAGFVLLVWLWPGYGPSRETGGRFPSVAERPMAPAANPILLPSFHLLFWQLGT